jgi:hypothetical protein
MKGAKRAVAVDVTGLPLAARVLPASVHDNEATRMLLADMAALGRSDRLQLVLVDRGVTEPAAKKLTKLSGVTVKRVGWDGKQLDENGKAVFRPIRHAWRVEVAHGELGWSRRLAKSFENTTDSATGWLQVACIASALHTLNKARAKQPPQPKPSKATMRAPQGRRLAA